MARMHACVLQSSVGLPMLRSPTCMCRWGKIAELVEGKDKLACARHFKEMKAQAKNAKG
jgi:hypothetical protein